MMCNFGDEVRRRVQALPEWPYLRREADAAWNAKLAADVEFMTAQAAVNELYARVVGELAEENNNHEEEQ